MNLVNKSHGHIDENVLMKEEHYINQLVNIFYPEKIEYF